MKYRKDPKSGNELSALGFGCMRLPARVGVIDRERSEKLVMSAIERGVNYFDTAYLYSGSEETLGGILQRNGARDKIFLATKLPWQRCGAYADFDRLFAEQKARLQTDRFDYYLIHNIGAFKSWQGLCDKGIEKWIAEKKRTGEIARIGFSFHGIAAEFPLLLNAYDWDFCQIQYNYMNETLQAGRAGLDAAHAKGLPVVVMEPLLGGKLATGLSAKAERVFAGSEYTPAQWGLRWLWNQPGVIVVLSGMNAMQQLDENVAAADSVEPGAFTEKDFAVIDAARAAIGESFKVPCTGCNYCMPCPHGVNIPMCFAAYNFSYSGGFVSGVVQYVTGLEANRGENHHRATRCTACGACAAKCPQRIAIPQELAKVRARLDPFWMQPIIKAVNLVLVGKRSRKT